MPIRTMTTSPSPGHLVHICAACGAEHTISFDRGAQKTRTGPFALRPGDTLVLKVDRTALTTVTFGGGDFHDPRAVSAAELAITLVRAVRGILPRDDAGGLLIESAAAGAESCIEVVDGTARAALGFATDGPADHCVGRPVLGICIGSDAHQQRDKNIIALRRCNDCGSNEGLVRTFDAAPDEHTGTFFDAHRRAVNALAEHWKARGWSHPEVAALHAEETVRPIDINEEFPAKDCVLPPAPVPQRRVTKSG
jgi:hypothetical protein